MFFCKIKRFGIVVTTAFLLAFLYSLSFNTVSVSAYSITMNTNNAVELDAVPSDDGVTIKDESINVLSDCRSGYNLSIATPEGSDLYKYDNNTPAANASFTAVDGTSALSSSNNINKWGYTLTNNPTGSTVFSPLSATTSTLKTSSQTASPSSDINDTFHIYYGVKVDNTIAPGTYQMAQDGNNNAGTIVYYLTMDTSCTQYTVAFNANGGTGTIESQGIENGVSTKLTSADSITAPQGASYTDANNNTITGQADKLWTFWGWNTRIDGTGDWYKDRESVTDLTNVSSTITLYAQWKQATLADLTTSTPVGTEKTIDHNTMQDMSPEACYNSEKFTAIGTPYGQATLTDNRDGANRTYTVAKLPDDSCWMTQNLNLGAATAITLTPDDTDITENFILPASSSSDYTTGTTQANINKAMVLNNMTVPDYTVNSTTYSGKVNAYYSYAAATADANTYSKSSATVVTTSICPKNWDLPTNTQYYNLRTKGSIANYNNTGASYAGKNAGNEPYYFIYGGYRKGTGDTISTTNFNSPTSYGYLWTANNSTYRYGYGTYVYSSGLYNSASGTTYYKYYGLSMRCVASSGTATINYDGNGTNEYPVTGTTATQANVEINSTNTSANGFTRAGWSFSGWNTAADGSGTTIAANTSILKLGLNPGETITLYAQWTPQYTITYVNNCMTYASANSACTQSVSNSTGMQTININASGSGSGTLGAYNFNSWTLDGWKISEWNTSADGTGTAYPVSGSYSITGQYVPGGVTLYAHWVQIYSIQFDGNGAENSNGMGTMDASTGLKSVRYANAGEGNEISLLASNFKRTGYGFAGWSFSPTATVGGSDRIYGPMETIRVPAYTGDIVTLYAVWVPAEKDGSNNPVYLQDFTTSDCNVLSKADFNSNTGVITPGSVIALTDKRDNQVYTVAKLADNNCWMIENLRLEHAGTVGNNVNDNSVTNQSLSQGYGGTTGTYGNFVGLAAPESANFSNTTTSLSFANGGIYKSDGSGSVFDSTNSTLEDIGTSGNPGYRFPRYNSDNTQSLIDSTTYIPNYLSGKGTISSGHVYSNANVYSYGNYYTWAAAMANTNYYGNSSTSEVANTSICPSNWHLPSSNGTTKEYGALSTSYGGNGGSQSGVGTGDIMSNRFRTFPNNFLFSGHFRASNATDRGNRGYYWSRTAYGATYSFGLNLESTSFDPSYYSSNYSTKSYGFSVRCLIGS